MKILWGVNRMCTFVSEGIRDIMNFTGGYGMNLTWSEPAQKQDILSCVDRMRDPINFK